MDETATAYENLLARFVAWAETQEDLRAAIIIGSRARSDHPADRWSDLDLVTFVTDTQRYLTSNEWLQTLGTPMLSFIESTADGRSQERRVLFANGLDVDFALLPAAFHDPLGQGDIPADLIAHLQRGFRIVIDKEGVLAQIQRKLLELPATPPPTPPTAEEFANLVNDFWYHTVWTAKHLRRGELWWAKSGCDGYLKQLLQRMMEWHARATQGTEHDTWFRGRFLEEWVDPQARAALSHLFAHYNEDDIWRALSATMAIFRLLAVESAQKLGYSYPNEGDNFAAELVRRLDAERTQIDEADAL
ncbi:MAG: aminoglycoside 6-adenylyltransferase [Caldilineaceae bacterium]